MRSLDATACRRRLYPVHLLTVFGWLALYSWWLCFTTAMAQDFKPNYDESKVPAYELPQLVDADTSNAPDFSVAWTKRRTELQQTFAEQMFGTVPTASYSLEFEQVETGSSCNGAALRQQFRVTVVTEHGRLPIELVVFTPAEVSTPVACFLALNFSGNHAVANDPELLITKSWIRNSNDERTDKNRATEAGRGASSSRWPIEQIVAAGMGVATAYYGDIDPDFHDEFRNGIHALFPEHRPSAEHPQRWGSIAAWAWGLSRLLDTLESQVPQVDSQRVAVLGHSRLGKTALWAGATDSRFAAVISNNSGCGGAALSRRAVGETVGRINSSFPHWFCPNFHQYNEQEAKLPIDQHQLLALAAPRLLYVASASGDRWADPHGEFLSLQLAGEVYDKLSSDKGPAEAPERRRIGYHLRDGKHDITAWDWTHYLRFVDQL